MEKYKFQAKSEDGLLEKALNELRALLSHKDKFSQGAVFWSWPINMSS